MLGRPASWIWYRTHASGSTNGSSRNGSHSLQWDWTSINMPDLCWRELVALLMTISWSTQLITSHYRALMATGPKQAIKGGGQARCSQCKVIKISVKQTNTQSSFLRYICWKICTRNVICYCHLGTRRSLVTQFRQWMFNQMKNHSLKKTASLESALWVQQDPDGLLLQWNLFVTTTSIIKCITCDLFSNVF